MPDTGKLTDAAAKASEAIGQAAAAAAPIAQQAVERATALAGQAAAAAGPIIEQGRVRAAQGVDVLVVIPHNAEATAQIVDKAHKEGIKVISYDRLIKNSARYR